MSKHSNREGVVMLHCQKKYPEMRLWRFDTGQAYALHSVKGALQEYKRTRSITAAMKTLVRLTYGTVGFPDLAGIYMGIFVGIEIKVGKDKQRKEQKGMESTIKKAGGIYILLDDKSPIDDQLKPIDGIKQWIHNKI